MQNRTDANFYFTPSQISSDLNVYPKRHIGTSAITTSAERRGQSFIPRLAGRDVRLAPATGSGDINWLGTTQGDNDRISIAQPP